MPMKEAGQKVLKALYEAGYEAYFVGGMVRDTLLGRDIYDVDITTAATPEEVLGLFNQTFATGLQHGTVTVVMDGVNIEVTTFRIDGVYLDNRRPDEVLFTHSFEADLARRDFTINAMGQQLDGTLIDPFNGMLDLKAGVIRAVGDPQKRFGEDALRILRGIRLVAKLGFDVDKQTFEAMGCCRHLLSCLSLERIRKELTGIIEGKHRKKAFELMQKGDLFQHIPYFYDFGDYPLAALAEMDDIKLMLVFVVNNLIDPTSFLKKFPLTRDEKKFIKAIKVIYSYYQNFEDFHDRKLAKLLQYKFGCETFQMKEKFAYISDILIADSYHTYPHKRSKFVFKPYRLAINSRADLMVQPEEVINLSKKLPGPWIGELFAEIEEAVVMGEIKNKRKSILKFIEERGTLDVKED